MMIMIMISKAINGISINGNEYLLNNNDNSVMLFESKDKAIGFLRCNGFKNYTLEQFEYNFNFEEVKDE